jgi:hypothetical protein
MTIQWKLERRSVDDLMLHPQNPRTFTERGMKDLGESISKIGMAQPININLDGVVLSGNARLTKLRELGVQEVDVYVPDRMLTSREQDEVIIRMNKNQGGEWDFDALNEWYNTPDLLEWGFLEDELIYLDSGNDDEPLAELATSFKVIVECDGEMHQDEVYSMLKEKGLKCRTITK